MVLFMISWGSGDGNSILAYNLTHLAISNRNQGSMKVYGGYTEV